MTLSTVYIDPKCHVSQWDPVLERLQVKCSHLRTPVEALKNVFLRVCVSMVIVLKGRVALMALASPPTVLCETCVPVVLWWVVWWLLHPTHCPGKRLRCKSALFPWNEVICDACGIHVTPPLSKVMFPKWGEMITVHVTCTKWFDLRRKLDCGFLAAVWRLGTSSDPMPQASCKLIFALVDRFFQVLD